VFRLKAVSIEGMFPLALASFSLQSIYLRRLSMNGYTGKFLEVDLTHGTCKNFTLDEKRLKKFIGGSSLAA
jgi:hypothetical protein